MPSNALDYITIKGFKSIASIEKLELRPINVLIGANGFGKSNFLDVFRLLQAIGEGRLQNYVGAAAGAEKILHFGAKTTPETTIGLSFSGYAIPYEVKVSPTADDGLFLPSEALRDPILPNLDIMIEWKRNRLGGWPISPPRQLTHADNCQRGRQSLSEAGRIEPCCYSLLSS
jgi:predicted ATPase